MSWSLGQNWARLILISLLCKYVIMLSSFGKGEQPFRSNIIITSLYFYCFSTLTQSEALESDSGAVSQWVLTPHCLPLFQEVEIAVGGCCCRCAPELRCGAARAARSLTSPDCWATTTTHCSKSRIFLPPCVEHKFSISHTVTVFHPWGDRDCSPVQLLSWFFALMLFNKFKKKTVDS